MGGYRLHLDCTGTARPGRPTVILEAAWGGTSLDWSKVQPGAAAFTRVCAYDRAGYGWSDTGRSPRTAGQVVTELHTLLTRAGVAGPYVLAGHSLGGLFVRLYAYRYPRQVAGLVLVDSPHEEDEFRWTGIGSALTTICGVLARFGIVRPFVSRLGGVANYPPAAQPAVKAHFSQTRFWRTYADEGAALEQSAAQVRAGRHPLGRLPLVVLTRGVDGKFYQEMPANRSPAPGRLGNGTSSVSPPIARRSLPPAVATTSCSTSLSWLLRRSTRWSPARSSNGGHRRNPSHHGRRMSTTTPATPAGPMRHDEAVLTVAAAPVRAYRAGTGPTLVLLHGGGLDDAQLSWAPVWPALTGHTQLLAPDLPGYGGSPLGHTQPTLAGYRTWLLAFLDTLGIRQAILVGLSLGGGIALRAALDAPTRVAGLVLLAPYGVSPQLPGGKLGYFAVHAPHAAAATDAALRHSDRLLRSSLRALLHHPDAVSGELLAQVRALLTRPDAQAAWSAFQRHEVLWSGPRTYLAGQLGAIGCPVLLLSGEHDGLVPPEDVRAAAARIPHARFMLVAGAGHWLPRDAPGQVTDQLLGFLAAAPAAPASLPDGP